MIDVWTKIARETHKKLEDERNLQPEMFKNSKSRKFLARIADENLDRRKLAMKALEAKQKRREAEDALRAEEEATALRERKDTT